MRYAPPSVRERSFGDCQGGRVQLGSVNHTIDDVPLGELLGAVAVRIPPQAGATGRQALVEGWLAREEVGDFGPSAVFAGVREMCAHTGVFLGVRTSESQTASLKFFRSCLSNARAGTRRRIVLRRLALGLAVAQLGSGVGGCGDDRLGDGGGVVAAVHFLRHDLAGGVSLPGVDL
jgi:hypothetical protein